MPKLMHGIYHVMHIASTPDICSIDDCLWSIFDLSLIMGDLIRTKQAFDAASEFLNPVLQRGMQDFNIINLN